MKIKSVKKKGTKANWAEDDLSETTNAEIAQPKKTKVSKVAKKSVEKVNKKNKTSKKDGESSSDDENFDGSLNKLKEIDPEFYKVSLMI